MVSKVVHQDRNLEYSNNADSESYEIIPTGQPLEAYLDWKDIVFKASGVEILKGVTGQARPKEILAIMGSSGSGKTSLLSILSNQIFPNRKNIISGSVTLNGVLIKTINYQTFTKYVMQQDILLPTLTPRESLRFAARLKVGGSAKEVQEKVEEVLSNLKLLKAADNIIGNEFIKGLSGGEKKRLSIGLEMIANPLVLILDEPTSGLDSYTSKIVIGLLKAAANSGKTIIMTIHQPSEEIYEMIDRLILMVSGHFVYQGLAKDAKGHFDNLGYVCGERSPPPDHFMRILHLKNSREPTKEEKEKVDLFIGAYSTQESKIDYIQKFDKLPNTLTNFQAGLFETIKICLKKSFLNSSRNPMLFQVKIMQAITIGTILALLFRDLGYGRTQVENRKGLLFFITVNVVMFGAIANCVTFPVERPLFLKDYKEKLYGVVPYYLSKLVAELPVVFLFTFFYSVISYFATDLNVETADHFFVFFGILFLAHLGGIGIGNFAGSVSMNYDAANVFGPTFSAPLMFFGGFFSKSSSLTTAFEWVQYISPFSQAYEAFIINEFTDLPIDENDFQDGGPIEDLGFDGEIWEKVGNLLLIILGCILLTLTSLKIIAIRNSSL